MGSFSRWARRGATYRPQPPNPSETAARFAQRRLDDAVTLPAGVYLDFAGSAAEQARSRRDLFVDAAIALVGILILCSMVVGSARSFLLVWPNLPFPLVGGILVVLVTSTALNLLVLPILALRFGRVAPRKV